MFFKKISQICLAFILASSLFLVTPVEAQVGLQPFNMDVTNPKERGLFQYTVNPGDSVEDFVLLVNNGKADVVVNLRPNDGIVTQDGTFTMAPNNVENVMVGKWIEFKENRYTIPASKSLKVPFKVSIPKDIKSGEYLGGMSVTELPKDESTATVAVQTRMANAMYIVVKGDLSLKTEARDLNIINPKIKDFQLEVNKRNNINKDNLMFKLFLRNAGNMFSNVEGKYKLTKPDGKIFEGKFSRGLAANSEPQDFYFPTNQPITVGKYTLDLEYQTNMRNEYKVQVTPSIDNGVGKLSTTFDFTAEDIKAFEAASQQVIDQSPIKPSPASKNESSSLSIGGEVAQNIPTPAPKEEKNDMTLVYVAGGVGFLLLILIALVAYKMYSDSKNKKATK
jgi:hypothetical protein